MKPEDVPDEWAEPVAMAMANAQCRVIYGTEPYTDLAVWRSISGYETLMERARHVLAAVLPLAMAEAIGEEIGGSCMRQYGNCGEPVSCQCQRAARAEMLANVVDVPNE